MGDCCKSVLCISDEATLLAIGKQAFESAGLTVTPCYKEEALATFSSQTFDAVVVDYSLHQTDGGIPAHIKQLKPQTPIITWIAEPSITETVPATVDVLVQERQDADSLSGLLATLVRLRSHFHPELKQEYVVFADSSRRYLDCSNGVCHLLGYPRTEMIRMSIDDVSYRPEKAPVMFEKFVQSGKQDGEYILRHKTGNPVFIRYRSHAFSDGCMAAVWERKRIGKSYINLRCWSWNLIGLEKESKSRTPQLRTACVSCPRTDGRVVKNWNGFTMPYLGSKS